MSSTIHKERKTAETQISVDLTVPRSEQMEIDTGLPFFNHMLHAMTFHGGFGAKIQARGDVDVDPHHLVEDVGLVLGEALNEALNSLSSPIRRFGHSVIPMDDSLAEVTVDLGGRPYLEYKCDYPQQWAGEFDLSLIREFIYAFSHRGEINIHAECRYGLNGHHMAEALFKALGRALGEALETDSRYNGVPSTKGDR